LRRRINSLHAQNAMNLYLSEELNVLEKQAIAHFVGICCKVTEGL